MNEAFICDAVRTPIGRYAGALAQVRPDDLAAHALKALMARSPKVDWALVDDVILGCANQAGEDNRNVARMAALLSGMDEKVSGSPASRAAMSATFRLSSPAWLAQPRITSSTAPASPGCRARSARIGIAARSSVRTLANAPP